MGDGSGRAGICGGGDDDGACVGVVVVVVVVVVKVVVVVGVATLPFLLLWVDAARAVVVDLEEEGNACCIFFNFERLMENDDGSLECV